MIRLAYRMQCLVLVWAATAPLTCCGGALQGGAENMGQRTGHSLRFEQLESRLPLASSQAPVVDAGPDLNVALPDAAAFLGTVSDDGPLSALHVSWTQVHGPGEITFEDPGFAQTKARFSEPGVYNVRLEANDGELTSTDYVRIHVLPAAPTPGVDAGADQTVSVNTLLPLDGAITSPGWPDSVEILTTWTAVSGPSLVRFVDPGAEDTFASFSLPGTYVLELEAHYGMLLGSDQTVITVHENRPPVVNAGPDQQVQLPETIVVNNTVADTEVVKQFATSVIGYSSQWSPGSWSAEQALGPPNVPAFSDHPNAWAPRPKDGGNEFLELGFTTPVFANGVTIWESWGNGFITEIHARNAANGTLVPVFSGDDPSARGSVVAFEVDFPQTTFLVDGVRLTVNTNHSQQWEEIDAVELRGVRSAPPDDVPNGLQILLDGTVSDDGLPTAEVATQWRKVSGPGNVAFNDPSSVDTTAIFVEAGVYVFRLEASDGEFTTSDETTITVTTAPVIDNLPPLVSAGPDQTVLASVSLEFNGAVSDDGLPEPPGTMSLLWHKVSGPGDVTFSDSSAAQTKAIFTVVGTYVVRLEAFDGELTSSDDATITVTAPVIDNLPPLVSAGPNQTVLTSTSLELNGAVSDDGLPESPGVLSLLWSKISGPGEITFSDASAAQTKALFAEAGTYVVRLEAFDGELTGSDDTTITVEPQVQPTHVYVSHMPFAADPINGWGPAERDASNGELAADDGGPLVINGVTYAYGMGVHAGSEITLNLLGNYSRFLSDIGLDDEVATNGSVTFEVWADGIKIFDSGLMNVDSPAQTVDVGVEGVDQLKLIVTDGGNGNHSDHADWGNARLVLAVASGNQAPVVNAGLDQSGLVQTELALAGSVADDSLPGPPATLTTTWSKVSGPGDVTFGDASAVTTTATFSQAGTYILRLAAFDGQLIANDEVVFTIDAAIEPQQNFVYLSDLPIVTASNGWGPVELDSSNGETPAGDGNRLTINGVTYDKGLGVHSNSEVTFKLASYFSRFISDIGVDDEVAGNGSVTFEIWTDGSKVFDSGVMNGSSPAQTVDLDLAGVDELKLIVTDAGNGPASDHANWANARLVTGVAGQNRPPWLDAGLDATTAVSRPLTLKGTVIDDFLPGPPDNITSTWRKLSGPGNVTFIDPTTVDTSANFGQPGAYVLGLSAHDGELSASDTITVTVTDVQVPDGFFVSPIGTSGNDGSLERPWSLQTALSHPAAVKPGDTIWLKGGTYRGSLTSSLKGTAQQPIIVQAYPGERVTIDIYDSSDRTRFNVYGSYTHFVGLELTSTDPKSRVSDSYDFPVAIDRGTINVYGDNIKLINNIIHDLGGPGFGGPGGEQYGTISYNNGIVGAGAHRYHGIYTNGDHSANPKRIVDNIFFNNSGFGIHAWGNSSQYVRGFQFEGNISFNNGAAAGQGFRVMTDMLVGSGSSDENISIVGNYTYQQGGNSNVTVGWGGTDKNLTLTNNYFASGDLVFRTQWQDIHSSGNTIVGSINGPSPNGGINVVTEPSGVMANVRPNVYENGRGHVVVYNWNQAPSVNVDLSNVLTVGASYEIHHVYNLFGQAVVSGTYDGGEVAVPMRATPAPRLLGGIQGVNSPIVQGPEFAAFVVRTVSAPTANLVAASDPNPTSGSVDELRLDEVTPIFEYAIQQWIAAGISDSQAEQLRNAEIRVADLDGPLLGQVVAHTLTLDKDAAGHGWFKDSTPTRHQEYSEILNSSLRAHQDSPAAGRIDLLTVVLHELGHLLGHDHHHAEATDQLMSTSLQPGVRHLLNPQALDAVLAAEPGL